MKLIQQGNSTLKANTGSISFGNDSESALENQTQTNSQIHSEVIELEKVDSDILSEAFKSPLKPLSESQQYNISSALPNALKLHEKRRIEDQTNFVTLANISEDEKIEIITRGFQVQTEGKISLKKYYEGTEEYSLFQSKGYNIKYDTIRKNNLYQQLKK